MNLARCTPADEILVAYVTDMTMQKKVMTKKRSSDFWSGKVHPRRENPGYAYECDRWKNRWTDGLILAIVQYNDPH